MASDISVKLMFVTLLSIYKPTITKAGLTGNNWYLWVLAKDTKKNTSIVRSEAFYFDNTAPTCNITSDGSNLIVNGSDSQSGLDTLHIHLII